MPGTSRARLGSIALLTVVLCATLPATGWTWGLTGHRFIAQHYSQHLPAEAAAFQRYDSTVYAHVLDPDIRTYTTSGEGDRHFIDVDAYPEFLAGTLPRDRATLEARYGTATVQDRGVLPWAIAEVMGTLTGQFRAGQWDAAALTIADLCHYAGDLNQPLHATRNYDGQLTGNDGLHSRHESTLLDNYAGQLATPPMSATYIASPLDAVFDLVTCSWRQVDPLLWADNTAKAASGGAYNSTYYASLWANTRVFTQARLDTASVTTASLVYTAWVDAGRPPIGVATTVYLRAGPAPFDDHLNLYYNVLAPMSIDVYDARGARVAHVADDLRGEGQVTWRPADTGTPLEAGIYFVRLDGPGVRLVKKVTFCPRPRPYVR